MQSTLRRPGTLPRPPRPAAPKEHDGPAWVSAPPPAYHDTPAVHLDELGEPAPPEPQGPATRPLRCPRCHTTFDWTAVRPTVVTCPACRATGRVG
jgi:hypothetical protein